MKLKINVFLILFYLLNLTSLYGYYEYTFESEDELDFAFESGNISYEIYRDLKDEFEFDYEEEQLETEKETEIIKKINIKNVVESENYLHKTDGIIGYSRMNFEINRFKTGLLFMHKNEVLTSYDSQNKIFVYENVKKKNTIDKFFINYQNKNTNIFVGNFRALFAQGLTFAKTNSTKEGLYPDLILPVRRSIVFRNQSHRNYIPNSFLKGLGIEQKIFEDFKLSVIYSEAKNPLDDIPTKDFDGTIKNKTIAELDNEKILATKLEYDYFGILNLGIIHYKLKNEYFLTDMQNVDKTGNGCFLNLFLNRFYYNHEISNVSSSIAFINKFGFNSKDLKFEFSYRNYPKDYDNPLANSLSLHPNKKYFNCNDEKGYRAKFDYGYEIDGDVFRKIFLNLQTDVFSYNKRRVSNEIVYYPDILSKYHIAKLKYFENSMGYEVVYKIFNRDVYNNSSAYYQRKDEKVDYKIEFRDTMVDFYIKYSNLVRGTDVPDYRYTSEYLTLFFKLKPELLHIKNTSIINQLKFSDTRLNKKSDDKFSYIFKLVSNLNQKYKLKFTWYCLDLIEKNQDEDSDFDIFTSKIQEKWRVELEILV